MMIFLILNTILSLSYKELDVSYKEMYRLVFNPNGILDYNTLAMSSQIHNTNEDIFFDIVEGEHFLKIKLGNFKDSRILYIQKSFFASVSDTHPIIYRSVPLGDKNEYKFIIPEITIDENTVSEYKANFLASEFDLITFISGNLEVFIRKFLQDKQLIYFLVSKICHCSDYNFLRSEKYILLFFKNDLSELSTFFIKFKSLLVSKMLTEDDLVEFLNETISKHKNDDLEWQMHFLNNIEVSNQYKNDILMSFLLTDFNNILSLFYNPNHKFVLPEINYNEEKISATATLAFSINTGILENEFQVLNDNDEEIRVLDYKFSDTKLYLFFNKAELLESGNEYIKVVIKTPHILCETRKIYLDKIIN